MRLVFYKTWEEIDMLRERWNTLLAATASDTFFLTWEWLEAWWKNYGANRPLFVIGGWQQDELCGIAPFYLDRKHHWGNTFRCLRLLGDGSNDSDYLDCFARIGSEAEFMTEVLGYLADNQKLWDCLELNGTLHKSPCLSALLSGAEQRSWRVASESVPCATLPLPSRWDDYVKSLKPRFRTKLRSALAFFDSQEECRVQQCCDQAELETWLNTLFDLHGRRWLQRNLPGVFRSPEKRRFYHDISCAAMKCGRLAFHRLSWGERPLALQYGFIYGNRFYLLQEGYDPDFDCLRPGLALRGSLIRQFIDSGIAEYDFLAGTPQSKMEWGAERQLSIGLVIAPPGRSASIIVDVPRLGEKIRGIIRETLPPVIVSWRQQFQAWRACKQWRPGEQVENGNGGEGVAKSLSAQLYVRTPIGTLMRNLAATYELKTGDRLWQYELRRRRTPVCHILLYHRVNDEDDDFSPAISAKKFRAQMEYVRRHFPIVSLDQIARGEFPLNDHGCCVAITFDDGYRDNFVHAYPILKALRIPATIFLVSGCIECGEMTWYDRVRLAFKLTCVPQLSLGEIGGPEAPLVTLQNRLMATYETLGWLRKTTEGYRHAYVQTLFRALRVPNRLNLPRFMLSWDDVRQMAGTGITFGAHTVTHPALSRIDPARLHDEIQGCKNMIENRLQLPVRHFAYPFGQSADYSAESKRVVQEAGFESAVTTVWGFNPPEQDRFELRRFCPAETDPARFALKLDWYHLVGV